MDTKYAHIYINIYICMYPTCICMYPTRTEMCSAYKTTDIFWPVLYVSVMLYPYI